MNIEIFKPIRKSLSVQEMIQEQNYTTINRTYFDDLVQNIDIQEPIEELLLMD